jgi:hypothetical protein
MATIRWPFGGEYSVQTLTKVNATASGTKTREVDSAFSYLRCATASKGKKLVLTVDDAVPDGAILYINAQSASSEVTLGTGFALQTYIGAKTAAKGTGNWVAPFFCMDGEFYPLCNPYALK